jgi:hypothetical protein
MPQTWDLATVSKVQGLYSEAHVDLALLMREGVAEEARERLARHFVEQARALAVEVNKGDLQFHEQDGTEVPFTRRVRAAWRPQTNAAEMRGGPADGQVYALQHVGEPYTIAVMRAFNHRQPNPVDLTLDEDRVVYVIKGWNETERHWVYEPTA